MNQVMRVSLSVCALFAVTAVSLFAEDGAPKTGQDNSILSAIIASGPVEWVLLALSGIGVSYALQKVLTIKTDLLVPEDLEINLESMFADGVNVDAIAEATNLVNEDDSMLARIVEAALEKHDLGYNAMREAADNIAAAEHNKYMSQINWLQLLASLGPMLGLLGTVTGMISAFFLMASAGGAVDPGMLSGSIGGAMITTATGLIIAIPMLFFYFFLRARINHCALEAGVVVGEILDRFRNR